MDAAHFPIGQLLINNKLITPDQLDQALRRQKESGEKLGVILLDMGFITEETMFHSILSDQIGIDYVDVSSLTITKDIINRIPAKFAIHYKILPVEYKDGVLTLATIDPLNLEIQDEIGIVISSKFVMKLASEKEIIDGIRKYYGVGAETIDKMMSTVEQKVDDDTNIVTIDEIESEASISKFLNQIFLEAYKDRATDIHIEPFEQELQIRYRIDGVLYDAKVPKNIKHFKDSINSRIKILSNLNIAEKRLPQDGRFKIRIKDVDLDFRVSFLPTSWGESVVLRILNTSKLYTINQLGLTEKERSILDGLLAKPHGIILITGPTGSGKTTTLYSCLAKVNSLDKKIITIEDPVEYQLKGITQIQINPVIGLTFSSGLRSMLRHDPDIMMVGEIRDCETAEIAIQVALTGHLVFSTLHTNDSASAVARLLDMGIEPYLITSTVECFIAQRLVRKLCPKCKMQTDKSPLIMQEISNLINDIDNKSLILPSIDKINIFKPVGCDDCNGTGFLGREAIYEFLLIDDKISKSIISRDSAEVIKKLAVENGMKTLNQAGLEKVISGITTIDEILRVTKNEIN